MKKLKKLFANYQKPTPKTWRQIGDTLLIITSAAASYSILTQHPTIGIVIAVAGVIGKLLTNFNYSDPAKENNRDANGCNENDCVKP